MTDSEGLGHKRLCALVGHNEATGLGFSPRRFHSHATLPYSTSMQFQCTERFQKRRQQWIYLETDFCFVCLFLNVTCVWLTIFLGWGGGFDLFMGSSGACHPGSVRAQVVASPLPGELVLQRLQTMTSRSSRSWSEDHFVGLHSRLTPEQILSPRFGTSTSARMSRKTVQFAFFI